MFQENIKKDVIVAVFLSIARSFVFPTAALKQVGTMVQSGCYLQERSLSPLNSSLLTKYDRSSSAVHMHMHAFTCILLIQHILIMFLCLTLCEKY